MKTFRFKDFEIYKQAKLFRGFIRQYLHQFPDNEKFRLSDQIHRASLSIVLNIAEGSAKRSDKDFGRFLEMAIASVNEVVAAFDLAADDKIISAGDFAEIENQAENLARQIGGFLRKVR